MKPGDRMGPYTIKSRLGEGGMGQVFHAVGPDDREVALKLLRPELAADGQYKKRFEREATMAARVDHPHVVSTLDKGEIDGFLYLTQEFIPGGSLDDRLKREGQLSIGDTCLMCAQVASGLDAMHQAGLVHRDVKPHNIMLDTSGTAHVADFGLAKDREASTVLTQLGQAFGSIDYMPPEQIRAESVEGQADVYALGCVVFECISGSPPFADRKGMQVMWAHLRDEPPDPGANRDDVPDDFSWAMTRALEKDRDRRPPTATAYARMLRLAAGLPGSGAKS